MDKVGFVGWSLSIIMIFVSIKLGEHNSFFNKLIDIFVITMWVFWGSYDIWNDCTAFELKNWKIYRRGGSLNEIVKRRSCCKGY